MRRFLLASLGIVFVIGTANALIKAPLPLGVMLRDMNYVVVAKVENFYPDKPAMMLSVQDDIKGKSPFRKIPVNLTKGAKYQEEVLKRLGEGQEIVLLLNHRGKKLKTFAYTNGTWFSLSGQQTGEEKGVWSLETGEPYLRKTFKGTTEEFVNLLKDVIAGKKKPPESDDKEKSGFGPEFEKKSSKAGPSRGSTFGSGGQLFAVIPTLGVGAPIAILAILFPTVFGGVLILFRQWAAFIMLFSVNSTLLIASMLLEGPLRGQFIANKNILWLVMNAVTFGCFLWAWRRHANNVSMGVAAVETPERTENIVLAVLSAVMFGVMALLFWMYEGKLNSIDAQLFLVLSIGIWLATLRKVVHVVRQTRSLAVPLPTEGVMIGGVVLASVALLMMNNRGVSGAVVEGETTETDLVVKFDGKPRWVFVSPEANVFVSNPLIVGERVYAAAANPGVKFGVLYCIDRKTGKQIWQFDDEQSMVQVYSSPTFADGRVYIGEGFHDDPNCKIYCVDAMTGKKVWDFQTKGQTESSPTVALGRVYFGAGNEGFFCIDANDTETITIDGEDVTRQKVHWSYPPKGYKGRLLRFCGSPAVVQGRVFTGTGVDRNQEGDKGKMAVLCLDARTGKLEWEVETPLPCWGAPIVEGNRVYITLGNGDIVKDAKEYDPGVENGGAVWCLDAETGKVHWKSPLKNSILNEVTLDDDRLYVGSRSGHCVCLKKSDGSELWSTDLGSSVVGAPALARMGLKSESVLALGTFGRWAALDPQTGKEQWAYQLEGESHFTASPRMLLTRTGRQWFIAGSAGGDLVSGRAALYCIEDTVTER